MLVNTDVSVVKAIAGSGGRLDQKPIYELSGDMLSIGGTTAVTEEK